MMQQGKEQADFAVVIPERESWEQWEGHELERTDLWGNLRAHISFLAALSV